MSEVITNNSPPLIDRLEIVAKSLRRNGMTSSAAAVEEAISILRSPASGAEVWTRDVARQYARHVAQAFAQTHSEFHPEKWAGLILELLDGHEEVMRANGEIPVRWPSEELRMMCHVIDTPDGSDLEQAIIEDFREWVRKEYGL